MDSRWKSRKFIVAVTTQLAALAVLIWPQRGDAIVAAGQSVAALLVMTLSGMGYVSAEASVDRAAQGGETPRGEADARA